MLPNCADMAGKRLLYLTVLGGCFVFYIAYGQWLSWIILLTVLAAALLVAFAAGIPSPSITEDAKEAHMNQGVEDEYAFLFE